MFACFLLPVSLLFFGCSQSFSLNLGGRDKWYCKVMSFRKVSSNEYREHLSLKFQLMKWVMWGIKRRWPWHIFALMSSVRQKYFFGQINCNELLVYLHYQRYGLRKLRVHYPVWYGLDGESIPVYLWGSSETFWFSLISFKHVYWQTKG